MKKLNWLRDVFFSRNMIEPLKKNRLKGSRSYLCGLIDRCENSGKEWRENLTPWLESLGIVVLNPHYKPFKIGIEDDQAREDINRLKQAGKLREVREKYKIIRQVDLRLVDCADFLVVLIDINTHLCGSYEEIFQANSQKKPVLFWIVNGIEQTPSWLLFTCPPEFFFSTLDDLKEYILHIHQDEKVNDLGRWRFWNG